MPLLLLSALVLAAGAALLLHPRPPRLAAPVTGDAALAAEVLAAIGDPLGYRGIAVARLGPSGGVRFAGLGDRGDGGPITADTPFEIGSIAKALTGMLLADLAATGAVAPGDPLRAALPAVTGPAGDATLAELATHAAGLPSVPPAWPGPRGGANPYAGQDVAWLLRAAASTPRSPGGEMRYSNLGAALLGQALAARAGTTYPDLLHRRLCAPLGMTATAVHAGTLPPDRATGHTRAGRPAPPWHGPGWAPAGVGLWSTAADLTRLLAATRAGTAPGAAATTPRAPAAGHGRIGYGWFTTTFPGAAALTWHNGGTGGFRSYVGWNRATGEGLVLLSNTDRTVTALGHHLLGAPVAPAGPPSRWTPRTRLAVALLLTAPLLLAAALLR